MNKEIMKAAGFDEEVRLAEQKRCPFCKSLVGAYRDALSAREGTISGLCQECQDETFGA